MGFKTALFVILDYYNREVSQMISQKYGYSILDAYKKFIFSKTYEMLCHFLTMSLSEISGWWYCQDFSTLVFPSCMAWCGQK